MNAAPGVYPDGRRFGTCGPVPGRTRAASDGGYSVRGACACIVSQQERGAGTWTGRAAGGRCMDSTQAGATIKTEGLERLLEVTRKLATPFDLTSMLGEVVDAGRALLNADRGAVFLYDPKTEELYTTVATGIGEIRFPATRGIVGECAQTRRVVNVPDCYADARFNREVDRQSGYRTRCLLAVPLIGYDDALVGVLQVLNKHDGVFAPEDEAIAGALAAQCAVALQRVSMIADIVLKKKMEHELSLARDVQMRVFPKEMPTIAGYDVAGWSRPADQTGGDVFDLITLDPTRLMVLLGDATGHGIAPALSVTQVRAMLRVGVRLGADLDAVFTHINDQLCQDLASNRFVTAFLGVLDSGGHALTYHSGGQGPLFHFHAATGEWESRGATTFPMGMMEVIRLAKAQVFELSPGDIVCLVSDGILEYPNTADEQFGDARLGELVRAGQGEPMARLIEIVLRAVEGFGAGVPQPDDMTMLMVRRMPDEAR
jgi:sigma-B regulation protein RsbU (phosphoserine phosphatase)